jgi:two-component system phosphate regulon response regulator OmpR
MEFRTLQLFVENRGRVLTRDRILDLAAERGWEAFDRSVDLRVSRLRRKIEPNPAEPTVIRTVRGIGYILDPASGRG